MIFGTAQELREAVKRLNHFRDDFTADGPFTSLSPFGRNLALFYDHDEDMVSQLCVAAGAGRVLKNRCDAVYVKDDAQMQADIAAWWWRANQYADWRRMH